MIIYSNDPNVLANNKYGIGVVAKVVSGYDFFGQNSPTLPSCSKEGLNELLSDQSIVYIV